MGAAETKRNRRKATKRVRIEKVVMVKKYSVLGEVGNEGGIYPLYVVVSMIVVESCVVVVLRGSVNKGGR